MHESIQAAKERLRCAVRDALAELTPQQRATASESARDRLLDQRPWKEARAILFFAPAPDELDIWPLLRKAMDAGKQVGLPRFDPPRSEYLACRIEDPVRQLKTGRFGLREAADECPQLSLNPLDLILVPGVAFDMRGRRLGRGKGFYDRFLATARGLTCGVAFDQQIVREIPVQAHDVHVNCILTPSRWLVV